MWLLYFLALVSPTWSSFDEKTGTSALWVALGMVVLGVGLAHVWPREVAGVAKVALLGGAVGVVVGVVVGAMQGVWAGALASAAWTVAAAVVIAYIARLRIAGRA